MVAIVRESTHSLFSQNAAPYICAMTIQATAEHIQIEPTLRAILTHIMASPALHCKWLNTLSYMEHIGATKIARTQSGPLADFEVLKHTVEEARHAFYLKKMLRKIDVEACPTYELEHLMVPHASRQYLYRLDLEISRMLRNAGYAGVDFKQLAYLLTTYAIEVRADELYPVYQSFLETYPIKLSVRTIINEEEGHLEEMDRALSAFPQDTSKLVNAAVAIEQRLYTHWMTALEEELGLN